MHQNVILFRPMYTVKHPYHVCSYKGFLLSLARLSYLKLISTLHINKIQQDTTNSMQIFIYYKITLHVLGVHRTRHQEYIKLELQLLVQVIVSVQQPPSCFGCPSHLSSGVHKTGTAASGTGHRTPETWGRLLHRYYDLYQKLQFQFYVLLMTGAMDTRNM